MYNEYTESEIQGTKEMYDQSGIFEIQRHSIVSHKQLKAKYLMTSTKGEYNDYENDYLSLYFLIQRETT